MTRFEGTWRIEPLFVDNSGMPVTAPQSGSERVASLVTLQQVFQSTINDHQSFQDKMQFAMLSNCHQSFGYNQLDLVKFRC